MKTYLFFLLILLTTSTFAQPNFINKQLNSPETDAASWQIEFADMDNDGDEDLVGRSYYEDRILIYLNQNGVMDTFPQIIEINVEDFRIVDWNNDNLPDILSSGINLYLNQGNLNFADGVQLVSAGDNFYLSDVNNDNFTDIVESGIFGTGKIYENDNGNANVTLQTGLGGAGGYIDLNNDGLKDYVEITNYSPYDLIIYEATAPYQFVPVDTIFDFSTSNSNQGACGEKIIIEDMDGDGIEEVIVKACWKMYVLKITGNFSYDLMYMGDSFIGNIYDHPYTTFADIDQNGFMDAIVNNSIFFNNNFTFIRKNFPTDINHVYSDFAVADTDGDNKIEIWESYRRSIRMDRFKYISGTTISGREAMWRMYPRESYFGALIDVNNDNLMDLVYPSELSLVLSLNNGGSYTESVLLNNINAVIANYEIYPWDYNNDGWMDMIVRDG